MFYGRPNWPHKADKGTRWGVRYLTGDNLKVVWAKFSTLG